MEKIALIGESGSGKSTLLKIIAGLIQPKSGTILFENKKVMGPDFQLVAGEKGIAYLSQSFELRNNYRMEELLMYANEMDVDEANKLYKLCRIDHLMKRNSYELSGGEKQRIALARFLINKPTLLILDEPFSNLDLINKNILKNILDDVCSTYLITRILTSHDTQDILPWADKILVMEVGEIIQEGSPVDVFENPVSEYCAGLLGTYNVMNKANEAENKNKLNIRRPGYFVIDEHHLNTEKWQVKSINYKGDYQEISVQNEDEILHLLTQKKDINIGDFVALKRNL